MLIKGYDEEPLAFREDLLDAPGFWAAYLGWLCQTENDEIPDPYFFGIDPADFEEAYADLHGYESWPVFRIPFGSGHEVVVFFRNFEEDEGLELLVRHPEWDRHGFLATLDGHQAGPGLSWRELVYIAGHPDADGEGVQDPTPACS